MKKILKITSILGVVTIIKIFAGVIRAKFLAWQIGPAGIGLVSQAITYSMFAIQLCSLSVVMGITKNVSEYLAQGDERRASLTVNISVTLQFIASVLFIAAVLPFSGYLTKFVFSDAKYIWYFIGITVVTPFAIFLIGTVDPVFYGYRKITEYTRLMIFYTVVGLFLVFATVYFFKTEGMLMQIILISLAGFVIAYRFIVKETSMRPKIDFSIFRDRESRGMMRQLLKYGLTSFTMGSATLLTMLCLRSLLVKQFGTAANGHYQVAYAMSASYLPFITNAVWGYFYPAMCALGTDGEVNAELNQFIRFAIFISTGIAALCIIFRYYAIIILYSKQFMPAYDLLAIQAVGDIFLVLFIVLNTSLLARRKFRSVFLISTLGYNAVLIGLYCALAMFSKLSFMSLNIAIAAANLLLVLALLIYHRFDTGFVPTRGNIYMALKCIIFIAIVYTIPGDGLSAITIKAAVSCLWLAVIFTREEMKRWTGIIMSYFTRKATGA